MHTVNRVSPSPASLGLHLMFRTALPSFRSQVSCGHAVSPEMEGCAGCAGCVCVGGEESFRGEVCMLWDKEEEESRRKRGGQQLGRGGRSEEMLLSTLPSGGGYEEDV